mgnify:CR=1 FL=1
MAADAVIRSTEAAQALLDEILRQVLCRDFYGTATIELTIENGVVQQARDIVARKRRVNQTGK